jgi:alpha-D-xyloside xylohydrolase
MKYAACLLLTCAAHTSPAAVTFTDRGQNIHLQAWGRDSIRVIALPSGAALPSLLYPSALIPPSEQQSSEYLVDEQSLTNGNLRVSIDSDGLLRFERVSDTFELLRERVIRNFTAKGALDLSFAAYDGEVILGLGQHKTGKLQNKGQSFILQPINTEILIPVVHSSRDYSMLFDLPSFGSVKIGDESTDWHADSAPYLSLWVTTTSAETTRSKVPGWSERVNKYVNATGRAPRFPKWASGYWQSRNRYRNQSEVLAVAHGYKSLGLPLALLIIGKPSKSKSAALPLLLPLPPLPRLSSAPVASE